MNMHAPDTDVVHYRQRIEGTGRQWLTVGVVTVTDDEGTTHPTVLEVVGELDMTDLEQVDQVLEAITTARGYLQQVTR